MWYPIDKFNTAALLSPRQWSVLAGLVLMLPALLLILSCGATPTDTPDPILEPTSTPSPLQVMAQSSAKMVKLKTASFSLVDEGETSARFFGLKFQSMQGEVSIPDSFIVRVEATSLLGFINISIIAVEQKAFMSDIIDENKWNPVPIEALPFNFADLGRTLGDIIPSIKNPTFNGIEKVGGVTSWRIKGTVLSESLGTLLIGVESGHQVGLEVWIGQEQDLLRKIRIEGQIYSGDGLDVVRVLNINNFDEPVDIALPSQSEK